MKISKPEQKRIYDEYKNLQKENPSITNNEIAKKLGLSTTSLYRLRKNVEKMMSSNETEEELPGPLIQDVMEDFKKLGALEETPLVETVSGYVTDKKVKHPLNVIPFENVKIPAGLEGIKRDIVLYYEVFANLKIEEI